MRRYDIIFGILLILSIIDFAPAVPVLVQEERDVCGNVAHIPKDVTTVLGKRGSEQLDKFKKIAEEYFKKWGVPDWWQGSTQAGPERASSSQSQAGAAGLVSSSSASARPERVSSISALMRPDHGSMNDLQVLAKNPSPSINPASPNINWIYPSDKDLMPPPKRPKPALSKEFGQANEDQAVQQPNPTPFDPRPLNRKPYDAMLPQTPPGYGVVTAPSPNIWRPIPLKPGPSTRKPSRLRPQTGPGSRVATGQSLNVERPMKIDFEGYRPDLYSAKAKAKAPSPSNPMPPTDPGYGWQKERVQQPNPTSFDPRPLNREPYDAMLPPTQPGHRVVTAPFPNLGLPDDPIELDFGGYNLDAINPALGKGKESRRHIPSTARDGGDAAQRKLQSVLGG